jgi:hypothetical protein
LLDPWSIAPRKGFIVPDEGTKLLLPDPNLTTAKEREADKTAHVEFFSAIVKF